MKEPDLSESLRRGDVKPPNNPKKLVKKTERKCPECGDLMQYTGFLEKCVDCTASGLGA